MKRVFISTAIVILVAPVVALALEEGPGAYTPRTQSVELERSPLIQELHQARDAGDEALVRALEAQLPVHVRAGEELETPVVNRVSMSTGEAGDLGVAMTAAEAFGDDVKVSFVTADDFERNPSMASDSNGNFYVAWQDDSPGGTVDYIEVFKSSDGGKNWYQFGTITSPYTLETPSIAIGEGSTRNNVLVAYIVDDGTNPRYVEVATSALTGGGFTTHTVSQVAWEYFKPVIWTDSHQYSVWYAYLTAEAEVGGVSTNRNVSFFRSTNGTTWDNYLTPWGNTDVETWIDPDGTFGTTINDIWIACYNATTNIVYMQQSTDFGVSFQAQTVIASPSATPTRVDPDLEAAADLDNLFIGMTWRFVDSTNDDTAYAYTDDFGTTWSGPFSDLRDTANTEYSVDVSANEGGGSFHIARTVGGNVVRASRPQDLAYFTILSEIVTDPAADPSATYPQKGIASNWTNDQVGIAWADFRTGLPVYEIYYDYSDMPMFADGFESGNTFGWTSSTP